MQLRILSSNDVRQALPMRDAIEAMRGAFRALYEGRVVMPVRLGVNTANGVALFMPAYDGASGLGQKVVSVFGKNPEKRLPTIHALVTLYSPETGVPLAVLEGSYLTALRTGAVTGLATELMAQPEARVLTIFGAGATAVGQIEGVCAVRPIEEVYIVSRSASAQALAEQLQASDPSRLYVATTDREAAVRSAQIIVTATTSTTPVFERAWVQDGTFVAGVGSYRPDMQEVPTGLIAEAAVVVDNLEAVTEEAGDLLVPIQQGRWSFDRLYAELGALVTGDMPAPDAALIFFKSCGLAIEDVAAAQAVLTIAEREGLGQVVTL